MENSIGLFEFLNEAELQQYYDSFKSDLKIQKTSQLKYVTDEDLAQLGMSRPEQRRLKKFFVKYYPQNYLSKIKRLLGPARRDDATSSMFPDDKSPESKSDSASDGLSRVANKHIIPAENICINKELGTGEFGVVQQGVWTNGGHGIQVAIKCLYREQMHTNAMEFLKEAAIMHDIDHKSIVRLYGVVLHPDSLMLVTELAPLRSLLECLKEVSLRSSFPILTLCDFALQICEGMSYLENKRLIHRDLAARNVLVFTKNRVKISDFGLSRALGAGKDYYQTNFNVNLKLPIAWCAPECISYLRFTSASDVWAFGVTLWEMFSYGFQPWAAFSGHQILVAIDSPNYQRLEQPECCPREYYSLMLKCWNHDPSKRPKFTEISQILPDCKPEQVQAAASSNLDPLTKKPDQLNYKIGDVITVLDKSFSTSHWKGALNNGTTGIFNPLNTVSYLGPSLPSAGTKNPYSQPPSELLGVSLRSSLIRNDKERSTITRRKLRSDMISAPQGEVKHTGHVGLDGAYFGDVSFLEYNKLPRQVVTPYKPSEDLEQTPLINPNSPSHLTGNNGTHSLLLRETSKSDMNDTAVTDIVSTESSSLNREYGNVEMGHKPSVSNFSFDTLSLQKRISRFKWPKKKESKNSFDDPILPSTKMSNSDSCKTDDTQNGESDTQLHDYQEISDDEEQRPSDFGQSLLDEMELMFKSYDETKPISNNQDSIHANHRNELAELSSKINSCSLTSKKKPTVKPISAHDQRTLDSAIALANKLTVKSMTDLERDDPPRTPTSPVERYKFTFRFPLVGSHSNSNNSEKSNKGSDSHNGKVEKRNFSQEAQSVPDIQTSLTEESKLAYESLIEQPCRPDTFLKINQNHMGFLHSNDAISSNKFTFDCVPETEITKFKTFKPESTFSKTNNSLSVSNKNILGNQSVGSKCSKELISVDIPDAATSKNNPNPIPLPPKDPTKHLDVGKRHIRIHPLVTDPFIVQDEVLIDRNIFTNNETTLFQSPNDPNNIQKPSNISTKDVLNDNIKKPVQEITENQGCNIFGINPYENVINDFPTTSLNPFDTPSLNFEAQLENNFNSTDCCDGATNGFDFESNANIKENKANIFESPFNTESFGHRHNLMKSGNREGFALSLNENVDLDFIDDSPSSSSHPFISFEPVPSPFSQDIIGTSMNPAQHFQKKFPFVENNFNHAKNNIFDNEKNILSIDDSLETNNLMKNSPDRVSVEDLLEFADQKPCGRQRGTDSDEVRIMCKVLNQQVSPEACLLALDCTSWNVHRAIKVAKLKLMGLDSPTLHECSVALDGCEWDVARAAAMLADSVDIAQV